MYPKWAPIRIGLPPGFDADEQSGAQRELNSTMVFLYASPVYSLVFFALLLLITHVYWYSSIGPAKNDSLELW